MRWMGERLRALRPASPGRATSRRDEPVPRVAILVVNGFDRRGRWGDYNLEEARSHPWVRLCLKQIERHSRAASYEVLVWDNSWLPGQRRFLRNNPRVRMFSPRARGGQLLHGAALDRLVTKVRPETEFVVTLDTDSFPIRDGWIENLTGRLTDDVWLAGVWRDELLPTTPAFIHPCCTAVRADRLRTMGAGFRISGGIDVGSRLTEATLTAGAKISRLYRSNRWNPHPIMGAVYGDLIYHQGAGSRNPKFSTSATAGAERLRQALRDEAFGNIAGLVDALAGNREPREAAPLVFRAWHELAAPDPGPGSGPEALRRVATTDHPADL
jgi:hypothetical protein